MRQAGTYSGIRFGGGSGAHGLPLARIKKIMKSSGEEVKMISGEAPVALAKACELFIKELTLKSWTLTLHSNRRILQKDDVVSSVVATDLFDFLLPLLGSSNDDHVDQYDHAAHVVPDSHAVIPETLLFQS